MTSQPATEAIDVKAAAAADPALAAIIDEILLVDELDERELDRIQRQHPKDGRGFYSKREILAGFRETRGKLASPEAAAAFTLRLQTCPTRSLSGVLPVTVLTKPFPCPGRCVFCPSDVRMPKSYLRDEPGCQRATANRFDPYLQAWNRLLAYREMGHPTDKVELIVLGGTWSHYPRSYRTWFVGRLFQALNDFGAGCDRRSEIEAFTAEFPGDAKPDAHRGSYNGEIRRVLRSHHGGRLHGDWETLPDDAFARALIRNEDAAARCVGLAVETRPDAIDGKELRFLRELGVTKVQIGVQSLSDRVLALNQRGHDVATSRRALSLLRAAGFKLHVHWMANLLGSTPEEDVRDFAQLFEDPQIQPDELKVYPCSLIESAELMTHYESGAWRPYEAEELSEALLRCLSAVPETCRVTRVIRDIPSTDIPVGNQHTNLREHVEARARERGIPLRDIRSREVRGEPPPREDLTLRTRSYPAGHGQEHFLEWSDPAERISGFLRLYLPGESAPPAPISEIAGAALIREVHVYGRATALGRRSEDAAQHAGLGRELIARAESLARTAGFERLSVISAVGTRGYYSSLGFERGELYQHRSLI